ncbi:MAG TPA: threonine ammonia-lyase [Pseudoclavibacter sp.]|nr:threonine ammonia-lyase [Pseudoclavibacter sp.]
MTELATAPTMDDVRAAAEVISHIAHRTPVERSMAFGEFTGSPVFLKCENMQRTGSYKLRGATYRLSKLTASERAAGVVAASAGNHAQGVAMAARELGIAATIFMPVGVALPKLQATRRYGASVELVGVTVTESLVAAQEFASRTGAIFIPPYDHPDVIAGQATVGVEVMEQVPDVDTIVVPIGGGGLAAGVAIAARAQAQKRGRPVRVVGVQSEACAPYLPSLQQGHPVTVAPASTIADGILVQTPGSLNFEIIRELVDEVVTVSDDDIARAIIALLERAKLVVEPAGAVSCAALVSGRIESPGTTVAILSGGNIDPLLLERVIRHGLTALSRYTNITVELPDRPGQLTIISQIISECDANVIEVLHTRHGRGQGITTVELQLSIETRGPEHRDEVLDALRARGYTPLER